MTNSTNLPNSLLVVGSLHKNTNNCKFYNYWRWERTTWLCGMNKSLDGHTNKAPVNCNNVQEPEDWSLFPGSSGRMLSPYLIAHWRLQLRDTKTDQLGQYLEEKPNLIWRLMWGEITAQRRELHCYWLVGCGTGPLADTSSSRVWRRDGLTVRLT